VTAQPATGGALAFLSESHAAMNALIGQLLDALEIGAPGVRELWHELDQGVLAHLEAEERFVLPGFARIDPEEALALVREHGRIREQLLEVGAAVSVGHIRFDQSRALIGLLRAHADREEELVYRWADARLEPRLITAARRHLSAR
jgi:hypothetical protein